MTPDLIAKGSSMARVAHAAAEAVLKIRILKMAQSTRTAQEAADAAGCDVSQIVKSLIFENTQTRNLDLLLVSGAHNADMDYISERYGLTFTRCDVRRVRDETGFAIGGVAPIGHLTPITVYMDRVLLDHMVVWADSGIKDMKDLKGKRVFLGPPGGAATVTAVQMLDAATGYKAGTDFTQLNVDWNSGMQAFQDRQADAHMSPKALPDPAIVQLATLGKIRLLSLPEQAMEADSIKKAMAIPGRVVTEIPKDLYGANQVNEENIRTLQTMVGLGTHKWMSEEVIYNVTKTIMENNSALKAEAQWMGVIKPENALAEMNAPLHVGAYRYYKERGVAIRDELVPPEAKK